MVVYTNAEQVMGDRTERIEALLAAGKASIALSEKGRKSSEVRLQSAIQGIPGEWTGFVGIQAERGGKCSRAE